MSAPRIGRFVRFLQNEVCKFAERKLVKPDFTAALSPVSSLKVMSVAWYSFFMSKRNALTSSKPLDKLQAARILSAVSSQQSAVSLGVLRTATNSSNKINITSTTHGNYLRAFFISFDNSPAQRFENRRTKE